MVEPYLMLEKVLNFSCRYPPEFRVIEKIRQGGGQNLPRRGTRVKFKFNHSALASRVPAQTGAYAHLLALLTEPPRPAVVTPHDLSSARGTSRPGGRPPAVAISWCLSDPAHCPAWHERLWEGEGQGQDHSREDYCFCVMVFVFIFAYHDVLHIHFLTSLPPHERDVILHYRAKRQQLFSAAVLGSRDPRWCQCWTTGHPGLFLAGPSTRRLVFI